MKHEEFDEKTLARTGPSEHRIRQCPPPGDSMAHKLLVNRQKRYSIFESRHPMAVRRIERMACVAARNVRCQAHILLE
jgi:hypothetical protein